MEQEITQTRVTTPGIRFTEAALLRPAVATSTAWSTTFQTGNTIVPAIL